LSICEQRAGAGDAFGKPRRPRGQGDTPVAHGAECREHAGAAVGHRSRRTSTAGDTRWKPRATAAQTSGAGSEPLNESGATMMATDGCDAVMAYDFSMERQTGC